MEIATPGPDDPSPPVNVRLDLTDGRIIPVECRYTGLDKRGMHCWEIVTEVEPMLVKGMLIDVFPARSSIVFPMQR